MNVVRRRLLIPAAATAAAALGLTTLTACGGDSAAAGNTDKFDVVASFYPMAFLAEQIGGKYVNVTSLTEPGQEPHDLEISAKQTAALQESDAVLYLKGLQPSVDDAVAQSGLKTRIDASTLTAMEHHGNEVGGHSAEHDEHENEELEGKDPHIWLDPVKYAEVAKGVGAAFEKADPDHADTYKTNTEALVMKLGALNDQFTNGLKNTRTKVFITTHAAFGYLAERYGLTEEAISGLDPESEPSAARVKALEKMAKADGVTTVFYETLVSDKTAKTIAADADLRTDVLDPIEGITEKSRGKDYFSVQEANLKALRTALGAK
ncbi:MULTISPECIES: metal ABC transporter substrate-binding protein [Streptomyces]|uniref:Metal ABC transporter substrate-binding protein n=1 Tax=Streptomyces griseiscabiei TaxID=2993540 RepID=A0ABU4L0Y5_9ACTN|nr:MULTISPECIES: metal ABC transporter substrate-binding protein [Streptomyces]MBZ3900636.1 zinc ABC transporter substrate-binding protein [Streptomyces griseiscabiei]MDX2909241.1 metal ABC transporter substrate-binding protein [Streptomyces griseiscabiei]